MAVLPAPADILRQVVADSKLHQKVWAERLGYTERYVSLVLNGKRRISVEFAVRFAKATGVSARGLLRMQADLDLRTYLRAEAERNGQTREPRGVVERSRELAGSPVDRAAGQHDRRLVRNTGPTRYTGRR